MKPHLLTLAFLVLTAGVSCGQGTIQFNNGPITRFLLRRISGVVSNVPPNIPLNFGFFWGTNVQSLSENPVLPLGTMSSTPGVMAAPNGTNYPIPGTQPGQVVYGRVRGWSASFGQDWRAAESAFQCGTMSGVIYGSTDIRLLDPLATNGPGTIIWQTATSTNPNRFNPLRLFEGWGDGPCPPRTNTIAAGQTINYDSYNPSNYYTFHALSNDVVSVLLLNNTVSLLALELRAPDGSLVTTESPTYGLRLDQTGTYVLQVVGYRYALSFIKCPGTNLTDVGDGAYTLSPGAPRIAYGNVGDMDAFTFQAIAGDSVRLDLRKLESGEQPLRMDLFSPDCVLLASVTGQSHLGTGCFAAQTGNYTVLVSNESGTEPFNYVLTLTQNPIVPPSSGTQQYLSVLHCTNQIILRWETNSAGFVLERATDPQTANWLAIDSTPIVLDRHFYLNEGLATGANQFYRLRCTNCGSGTAAR